MTTCRDYEREHETIAPERFAEWAAPDTAADPRDLSGQLLPIEADALRAAAKAVPAGLVIVEVGSYTGKSAVNLAAGSHDGNHVPVYAIDLWDAGTSQKGHSFRRYDAARDGGRSSSKFHHPAVKEKFDWRIRQYDTDGLIRPIVGESREAAELFANPIGLLFIDAEHTYEAARDDLAAWAPLVDPLGVIAMHDYKAGGNDGVKRAVDEFCALMPWTITTVTGSLALLEREDGR